MKRFSISYLFALMPFFALAQADGDYQSRGTGNWFTASTWQVYINGNYENLESASAGVYQNQIPNDPPSNGQPIGEIAIRNTHIVTVNLAVNLVSNPLVIESTAQMIINNTASNPDISIDPSSSMYVQGLVALSNGATHLGFDDPSLTTFASGGVYEHRYTNSLGVILAATWEDGSTIRFTSYTNPPGGGVFNGTENLNQDYYNFEWNCPQSGNIDWNGNLISVRNNLSILSTDTGAPSNERLRIFGDATDTELIVGGDLIISGPSSVALTTNGTNNILTVNGNFTNSATIRTTFSFGLGSISISVSGNYSKTNSATRFTTNVAGVTDLSLSGNYARTTATTSATVGSIANINFIGGGPVQSATGSGTITVTGPINYFVEDNSVLNLGTTFLSGTGTFTLRSTATLRAGAFNGSGTNTAGAIQAITTQGNLRVSGTRIFENESTIIYNGTSAQQLGAGHPSSTIVNTIINNSAGVTTSGSRIISGDLTLQAGNLAAAAGQVLTLNRNIIPNSNFITTTATSDFVVNGAGLSGSFPFPAGAITLSDFTLNRSGGGLTLANNVTISGILNLIDGELNFTGRTLTLNGTMTSTSGSLFSSSPTSTTLAIGGTGAFGTLAMSPSPNNQVGTFTIGRSTSGTVTSSGDLFVASAFNLNNGNFINSGSLTLDNNCQFGRAAVGATITINRPQVDTGETYQVLLGGTFTTGLELPDPANTTDLGNLTIVSGSITLGQDVTINGIMDLFGGTFLGGANIITMEGSNWNDNAGTFTPNTSTVVFNSATGTTIGGSSTPLFGNLTLNNGATLTFPNGPIDVAGDIQINSSSTLNANSVSTTLNLSGTTNTNFAGGGKTYRNITVTKTGGADVALSGGVNLTGILNITNNNSDFGSNGNLTLISDASGTASIGQLLLNRTVSGDVIAQRFIADKDRAYRDISTPVNGGQVIEVINSGISVTGTTPVTSFPCGGCTTNNPSIYFYNETTPGAINLGYTAVTSSNDFFTVGRGYNLLVRNEVSPATMSLTGSINRFPTATALPVTYTSSGSPADDGWNFIGNPFPSAIDWDIAAGWTNKATIQGNQISVWDPSINPPTGAYRTWNGATGTLGNGRIAAGQGFWVQRFGAGAVLTISEQAKSSTSTSFYRQQNANDVHYVQVNLSTKDYVESAFIQKVDGASNGYDVYDGFKLPFQEGLTLSTLSPENYSLSINAIGAVPTDSEVPLKIKNLEPGNYTFSASLVGDFIGSEILIRDNYLHKINELAGSGIEFSVTDSPGSKSADRFTLIFGKGDNLVGKESRISLYPNPVAESVNIEVFSTLIPAGEVVEMTGRSIGILTWKKIEENIWKGSLDVSSAPSGMYIARVKFDKGFENIKFIRK